MSEQGKPFEGASSPFAKSPSTYSGPSPFAPGEGAATASPPGNVRRGRYALAGLALVLVVMAASAAGAVVAHEFWSASGSAPTAAPATGATATPGASAGTAAPGTSSGVTTPSGGSGTIGGSGTSTVPSGTSSGGFSFGQAPSGTGSGSFGGSGASTTGTGPANSAVIAAKVDPAIVDVNSEYSYQGGAGAGTGIVISSNGEVLTNNHVIDGATRITATDIGNGQTYEAKVIGYDPSHDIAVLQLQGASGLATAKLGDSSKLSVGDGVVGIGNAGGIGGTPSVAGGRVTGLNQSITAGDELGGQSEQLSGLIQTNANIQAGDSGGPLVDTQGRVVGMNTAGTSGFGFGYGSQSSGQAYSIPIDQAAKTAFDIVSGHASGSVHVGASAFLGVQLSAPSIQFGGFGGASSSSGSGVDVGGVVTGEPAEKAGLVAGDVITSLDGQSVSSSTELGSIMLAHHPGDTVKLGWTNASGQSQSASVELASGPPS